MEAAQGNTRVDSFSRARAGARLSLSPFVSNGSGGVHRLFEQGAASNGGDCLVDTQNQKNGIQLPPRLPGLIRPPMGGVTPPIGTLPPTGVTPGLPSRPTPPTGTLPPTGVTPGLTSRPTPPIGTLPPIGVTPSLPSRPTPPIGTLPPSGLTPGLPGKPTPSPRPLPPTGTLPPDTVDPEETALAPNRETRCTRSQSGKFSAPPCDKTVVPYENQSGVVAPITPGRDLLPASPWNVWTSLSFNDVDDDRFRGETEIDGVYFGVGVDRFVATNTVVGLQLEFEQSDRDSFDGGLRIDRTAVSAGPYISVLLDERWSVSGLLTVGNVSSDIDILNLSGSSDQLQTRASLSAIGQYDWSGLILRPQVSLTYTHVSAEGIVLDGTIANQVVSVNADMASVWYGDFAPSVEFSRIFYMDGGVLMPFVEVGAVYSFGEISNAFSPSQSTEFDEWAGTLELGARFATRGGFLLEASVAYNSIFVDDVDSLEAGLFVSWNF